MNKAELDGINRTIADRASVFYWQTDRQITPQQAGIIWADRHRYFTDTELVQRVNEELMNDSVQSITPLDKNAQTNLGNVNSVRVAKLSSGREIIIRSHPKGIQNGDDFAFHLIEKLPGTAISKWLEVHPKDEIDILHSVGKTMAQVHTTKVHGFGPFDNEKAKKGQLIGLHQSYINAIHAGLTFNLHVLEQENIFTNGQVKSIEMLFKGGNPFLQCNQPVLIHNDFADWNLLTDGTAVTGVLDWDESVGGDYVSDIACWSTFFAPERLEHMLNGYFEGKKKPDDFDQKFQLLRLRYTISKMTLRIRRYNWDPSKSMKEKIKIGKTHLAQSLRYFEI